MAAVEPFRRRPGALMAARPEPPPADFAYEYPRQEPTYSGTPSGVAPHWAGVPGADPSMRWHDLATAVRRFMIAARGRVPDSVVCPPGRRQMAPSEQWEAWLLQAGEDRLDAGDRFLALRTAIDMWPEIETVQIFQLAVSAYGQDESAPQPQRRRRGRW